jgi:hypothetical protein
VFDAFKKEDKDMIKNLFAYVAASEGYVLKVDVLRREVILVLKLHSADVKAVCVCN